MKKRIQFKINGLFAVEVDVKKNDDYEEIIEKAKVELEETITYGNETIENVFFENLEVVCSECGISLTNGEEDDATMCLQCEANKTKKRGKSK